MWPDHDWMPEGGGNFFGLDRDAPAMQRPRGPRWRSWVWKLGARLESWGLKLQGWAS